MTPALETRNLGRDFEKTVALDDLTVALPAGAITALLGPNGAGKTTFLRLAAGFLAPTRGGVSLAGRDPRDPAHAPAFGWLDDHGPPAWMTIRALGKLQREAVSSFDADRFQALLDQRQISPKKHYGTLSKGQRRWVQAALLFASASPILFLDEPADGLDPESRHDLYDLLRDHIVQHDAAAVVATHALADIERVADHIALINKGRLLLSADLEILRARVREASLGPGQPLPPNLLAHAPDPEGDTVWFHSAPGVEKPADSRHVNLEALYLALVRHGVPNMAPILEPSEDPS